MEFLLSEGLPLKSIQTYLYLLFYVFSVAGTAQEIETKMLTLPEAIEQALNNYPSVQIQRYEVEQAQGLKATAGLLPNPIVTLYREDLGLNNQDAGETTVFAGLPLNFLWSHWSQVSAASAQVDAEELMLTDVQRLIKFEVQTAFAETHFAQQDYQALQKAADVFRHATEASRVRFSDGDMAGYEHQRIMVEYLRYQNSETEARVRLNNSQRQLAFLIDPDQSEVLIQTSATFPSPAPDRPFENLLRLSMDSRPDLQAARATLRSTQAALTANKWARLPKITASAGYKRQVDDFKGTVLQVNFGLPLFNRNQGNVRSASAELNQQVLATELMEKRVAMEVRQAHETYQLYHQQAEQLLDEDIGPPEQLLETARFSYEEGEMSLLELLDGVRAYTESFQARNDLLLKYQLSIFELEKAIATPVTTY
jgi:cobalt-zinc-cadmium efflux system outer membrane protein